MHAASPTPPLYVSIQGKGGTPNPPLAVRAHNPLLSALLPQLVEPSLQPLAVYNLPLPHLLTFPIQQGLPPLQPLFVCAPPPLLYVSLQGQGEIPLLTSTVRTYVTLLSDLLF